MELYDRALTAVDEGEWNVAIRLLGTIADKEGPHRFHLEQMESHGNEPHDDWDGAFTLDKK